VDGLDKPGHDAGRRLCGAWISGSPPPNSASLRLLSPHEFYDGTRFIVVCPMTSRVRPFGSSVVLPDGSPIAGAILVAQIRTLETLAAPLRFSGMKIDRGLLSAVRRKIAFLCGVSTSDLSAE